MTETPATQAPATVRHTGCCIVGAGPGGAILALLLARQGVDVTLLEAHHNFDRDFRGDTVHPSTLEVLDQLDLVDGLLALPHSKISDIDIEAYSAKLHLGALQYLKTKFNYIAMMPQSQFIDFVVGVAKHYPNFHLELNARVESLLEASGQVTGVRYRGQDGWHEVRTPLVVGADGRFSKVRQLAGVQPVESDAPMDVLWFRLPRHEGEAHGAHGRVGNGHLVVMLERMDEWQIAYVIRKGGYKEIHDAGLQTVWENLAELIPDLKDRVDQLADWKQVAVLSVQSSRVTRWHKPGLLLIGDAAHVMSPVGGVGINYAIQDAVATANLLGPKLRAGNVTDADLAAVQRRREWPTKVIQTFQNFVGKRVLTGVMSGAVMRPPAFMRWRPVQHLAGWFMAFGVRPERVDMRLLGQRT